MHLAPRTYCLVLRVLTVRSRRLKAYTQNVMGDLRCYPASMKHIFAKDQTTCQTMFEPQLGLSLHVFAHPAPLSSSILHVLSNCDPRILRSHAASTIQQRSCQRTGVSATLHGATSDGSFMTLFCTPFFHGILQQMCIVRVLTTATLDP